MSRSVNIESELHQFKQDAKEDRTLHSRIISKEDVSWELFQMRSLDEDVSYNRFYAIEKNKVIGVGCFGTVYPAYRVLENGDLNFKDPWAVKKIKPTKSLTREMIIKEAKTLACFYKTDLLQHVKTAHSEEYWLFMEYLPGKQLCDKNDRIHEDVANLSWLERLGLIVQLAIQINGYHHHRLNHDAMAHFDIKGRNIILSINENPMENKISIIDFGLAEFFASDDPTPLIEGERGGGYSSFPPEYMPRQAEVRMLKKGLKQDIYALTPFVAILLGAKQPFSLKDKASPLLWKLAAQKAINDKDKATFSTQIKAHITAPYAIDDMLEPDVYPSEYPQAVKGLVADFLNRMQAPTYNERPDSDEFLTFFTTLLNFFKAYHSYFLQDYLEYCGQQEKQHSLIETLADVSAAELEHQKEFKQYVVSKFPTCYKTACWLPSIFGAYFRSDLGCKIMKNEEVSFSDIYQYAQSQPNGLAAKIFQQLQDSFSKKDVQNEQVPLIRQLSS